MSYRTVLIVGAIALAVSGLLVAGIGGALVYTLGNRYGKAVEASKATNQPTQAPAPQAVIPQAPAPVKVKEEATPNDAPESNPANGWASGNAMKAKDTLGQFIKVLAFPPSLDRLEGRDVTVSWRDDGGFAGGFSTVCIVRGGKDCERIDSNHRVYIVGKVVRFDERKRAVILDNCRIVEIREPNPDGMGLVTVWKTKD